MYAVPDSIFRQQIDELHAEIELLEQTLTMKRTASARYEELSGKAQKVITSLHELLQEIQDAGLTGGFHPLERQVLSAFDGFIQRQSAAVDPDTVEPAHTMASGHEPQAEKKTKRAKRGTAAQPSISTQLDIPLPVPAPTEEVSTTEVTQETKADTAEAVSTVQTEVTTEQIFDAECLPVAIPTELNSSVINESVDEVDNAEPYAQLVTLNHTVSYMKNRDGVIFCAYLGVANMHLAKQWQECLSTFGATDIEIRAPKRIADCKYELKFKTSMNYIEQVASRHTSFHDSVPSPEATRMTNFQKKQEKPSKPFSGILTGTTPEKASPTEASPSATEGQPTYTEPFHCKHNFMGATIETAIIPTGVQEIGSSTIAVYSVYGDEQILGEVAEDLSVRGKRWFCRVLPESTVSSSASFYVIEDAIVFLLEVLEQDKRTAKIWAEMQQEQAEEEYDFPDF